MPDPECCVYILASDNHRLYVGMTSDLVSRLREHRDALATRSFTSRYRIWKLVFVEFGGSVESVVAREKQIKSWRREKKIALIEQANRDWVDLAPGYRIAAPVPDRMAVWRRLGRRAEAEDE
jgi:putative endonuclease